MGEKLEMKWLPTNWKTASGFVFAHANGYKTQAIAPRSNSSLQKKAEK